MKLQNKLFVAVMIVMFVTAVLVVPALAQGETPPASALDSILAVFLQFASLAGVGAFLAGLVNVLKQFGIVSDGTAGRWFAGLSLVAIGVLVYLKLFQPQIAFEYIDAQAAVLAQILLLILGYVIQLGAGITAHAVFADLKLPVIGKSFSRKS